jgi:peptide deformylase
MALRKVAVMGHPVLRKVAEPIPVKEIKTPKIQGLIQDMVETMFEYDGRGLAAPQVHESIQLVVMLWDFEKDAKPVLRVLINPEITALTEEKSGAWEGCLSLPGLRGYVDRPNKISVKSYDQDGKKQDFIAEGFAATVIQHECDHLLGKLYVDRITDLSQFAYIKEYNRFAEFSEDEGE